MLYIIVAIVAYLLFSVNAVIDKSLLQEKRIGHPAAYAFAIGILSIIAVVLAPFGFHLISFPHLALAFFAGALFTFSLLVYFAALKRGEASRVVPIQGGFVPLFTLILAFVLVKERLTGLHLVAVLLLIFGSVFVSYDFRGKTLLFTKTQLALTLFSSLLFASSFTLTKVVFGQIGFINGFVWTRFGMGLGALLLLLAPGARRAIIEQITRPQKQTSFLFFGGQAVGAVAGFLQNLAISLGSVTVVNALQGVQFVFLLGITSVLAVRFPKLSLEQFSRAILLEKIAGIILISVGIVFLTM